MEMKSKLSPEQKIVAMTPKLLKTIKKILPQIRSKYAARELINIAVQISNELKLIKSPAKTK